MRVLRVPVEGLCEGEVMLDPEASHYVLIVHRLKVGDPVILFDPRSGLEAAATLQRARSREAYCRVGAPEAAAAVPRREITLIQAFAKGDKVDRVISEATALGVTEVLIVATERCVTRSDGQPKHAATDDRRRQRWERIAIDAARQSGRGNIPNIGGPMALSEAVTRVSPDRLRLLLSPRASDALGDLLARDRSQPIALLIGPEGGLTSREEDTLTAAGFQGARFGDFVLRTETCATAVLGAIVGWHAR